jgi:hypothetical protein
VQKQILPLKNFRWMPRYYRVSGICMRRAPGLRLTKTQRKRILPIVDILPAKPQYLSFIITVIIKLYPIFRDHKLVRTYHVI